MPSWKTIELCESFQFWLSMPVRRAAEVFDEAVAVAVAGLVDPRERAPRAPSSSRTIASSPLQRHSSESRTRKSGVASTVP